MAKSKIRKKYPHTARLGSDSIELGRFSELDVSDVLEFASALSEQDQMFLRFDMTKESVVRQLLADQEGDQRVTVIARAGGAMVGYGSLSREPLSWTRHLGEIRIIVATGWRAKGLGALLAKEIFEISKELELRKVVARMALRQEGARRMFEHLGFAAEALLPDWVVDRAGRTHDLLIMGHDVSHSG